MPARVFRIDLPARRTDRQIQDEFDDLMTRACHGDRFAVAAIAIAFSVSLIEEARVELGRFEQDADDVVRDFFLDVLEGCARFDPGPERASVWMMRIVRELARQHRAERERESN